MRMFFALWPDDETRLQLAGVATTVLPERCRPVPPENYHLTLLFVGTVPDGRIPSLERCVHELAMPPVTLSFDTTGRFRGASVAWLGPTATPAPLAAFRAALTTAVAASGFEVDSRPFAPHLTIARPCRGAPRPWHGPAIRWHADRFVLCRSDGTPDGVRYSVVAVSAAASMR